MEWKQCSKSCLESSRQPNNQHNQCQQLRLTKGQETKGNHTMNLSILGSILVTREMLRATKEHGEFITKMQKPNFLQRVFSVATAIKMGSSEHGLNALFAAETLQNWQWFSDLSPEVLAKLMIDAIDTVKNGGAFKFNADELILPDAVEPPAEEDDDIEDDDEEEEEQEEVEE